MSFTIKENDKFKICQAPDYNFVFRKSDGYFVEYGKNIDDDPDYALYGPNILDLELSSAVSEKIARQYQNNTDYIVTKGGCAAQGCSKFCYKLNNKFKHSLHLSHQGIVKLLDKTPNTLCQVAAGITQLDDHPELWKIFEEINKRGMACNVTVNGGGASKTNITKLIQYCKAVAVSVNEINKEKAYSTIQLLSQSSLQVNIHYVLSLETLDNCIRTIEDCKNDCRLKNLNALVLLMYKDKNNTNALTTITDPLIYKKLIDYAKKNKIPLGLDSCSSYNYLEAIKDEKDFETQSQYVTSCCGGRFSAYIDIFGHYHACSFLENRDEWGQGLDVFECEDFINDIWNHPQTVNFRNRNIACSKKMRNPCKYFD